MDHHPATSPAPGIAPDANLHCPSCGYNLTGLTRDKCPECGQLLGVVAIKEEVLPTTALAVAVVGSRLLALYLLYSGIVGVGTWLLLMTQVLAGGLASRGSLPPMPYWLPQVAGWTLSLMLSLALWFGAPWLAQRMIPRARSSTRILPADGRMLLTAGCVVVGLFVLGHALEGFVFALTTSLFPGPALGLRQSFYVRTDTSGISAAIEIVFGLWLVFGSGALVRAIIYLRGLGPTADAKK